MITDIMDDGQIITREAVPIEFENVARLLHDAFFRSREHRYFAGATKDDPGATMLGTEKRTTRLRFYWSNVRATHLLGGHVRVATKSDGKLLGATLWLPPQKMITLSPIFLFKTGFLQVFFEWGYKGYKRLLTQWEDIMEAETNKRLSKEEQLECWKLHMFGVDPETQGRGIGALLLDDASNLFEGPSMLHCTTRARALYSRKGYVERGRWRMLSGIADQDGWPIKGKQQRKTLGEDIENSFIMVKP